MRSIVAILVCLLCLPVVPARAAHEDEATTVAKCLEDLAGGDLNSRRRAVLVLSKYRDNPRAQAAVIGALGDDQASIRRSAAVGLIEDGVAPAAVEPLWACLGDADVHLRRLVSSNLGQMLQRRQIQFMMIGDGTMGRPPAVPAALEDTTRAAFRDPDATVRRNMIANWRVFGSVLDAATVEALLQDPERDIRIQAIPAASRFFGGADLVEHLAPLARDTDALIRRQVADVLAVQAPRVKPAVKVLETLRDDPDFQVSTTANLGLLGAGHDEALGTLLGRLDDPRLDAEAVLRILRTVPTARGDAGKATILGYLANDRAVVRLAAIQAVSWFYADEITAARLRGWLADPAPDVRELAALLVARQQEPPTDLVREMAASRYPDVRRRVLPLSRRLPPEVAADVLFDLVIDDDESIRVDALRDYGRRRLDGAQQLLLDSLGDPAETIFAVALDTLLAGQVPAATLAAIEKRAADLPEDRRQTVLTRVGLQRMVVR